MGIRGGSGVRAGEQRVFASDLPPGWLECNGAAVLRAAYPGLFLAIGTRYGAGDGATTFNLPDKRGRGSISRGQGSGLTNRVQGAKHGAETVALGVAEMPVHTHSQNAHAHTVLLNSGATATYAAVRLNAGAANNATCTVQSSEGATATNNNNGSGGAHSNMPPVEVDIWGIKF